MSNETKVDDGGYVYARPYSRSEGCVFLGEPGITRRDYYAGLAMQGLLTALGSGIESFHEDKLVLLSYKIAAALIAEGRKGE